VPTVDGLGVIEGYEFPLGTLSDTTQLSHTVSIVEFEIGPNPRYILLPSTTTCGSVGLGNGLVTTFYNSASVTVTVDNYVFNRDARKLHDARLTLGPGMTGTAGVWDQLFTSNGCRSTAEQTMPDAFGYGRLEP
jgi:hypothetical protein